MEDGGEDDGMKDGTREEQRRRQQKRQSFSYGMDFLKKGTVSDKPIFIKNW